MIFRLGTRTLLNQQIHICLLAWLVCIVSEYVSHHHEEVCDSFNIGLLTLAYSSHYALLLYLMHVHVVCNQGLDAGMRCPIRIGAKKASAGRPATCVVLLIKRKGWLDCHHEVRKSHCVSCFSVHSQRSSIGSCTKAYVLVFLDLEARYVLAH